MLKAKDIPKILSTIERAEDQDRCWSIHFDGTCHVDPGSIRRPRVPYKLLDLGLDLRRAADMGVRVGITFVIGDVHQVAVTDPKAGNWTVYAKTGLDVATSLCQALNKTMLNRLRLQVGLPKL